MNSFSSIRRVRYVAVFAILLLCLNALAQENSPQDNANSGSNTLRNIVKTDKSVRAYGLGEYRVGGRCLCCDNFLDGDCIVVHTTARTDKIRIPQIVDGKIEADTNNPSSYFGNVLQREHPDPVNYLMIEINYKKMRDVYKVIVYTMIDAERKKSFLKECELGYNDRFERLQWVEEKREGNWSDGYISFQMEKPIFTNTIFLKIRDGRSRVTEVDIFAKD